MILPAGADNGSCIVVMSKGTRWQQQSYKVDEKFPYEWIKKKWAEKFAVTSIASCVNNGEPRSWHACIESFHADAETKTCSNFAPSAPRRLQEILISVLDSPGTSPC